MSGATSDGGGMTEHDPLDVTPLEIDPLLDDRNTRIVVCCGSGGVGKTTTAAALGVRAAERGRKVVSPSTRPAGSPSPWA